MSYNKFDRIKKELLEIKERINALINMCDESLDESQIDINLLRIMKEKIKKGASTANIDDILKIFTLLKQVIENDEDLRTEIKRWIDSVDDITISHFSTHLIGSGVVFAGYVKAKREEENG